MTKIDWKIENSKKYFNHAASKLQKIYPYFIKDIEVLWEKTLTNMSVLEMGCGPGFMLEQFCVAKAKHVVGLDISREMLLLAKNKNSCFLNCHFIVADACNIPLKDESFDLVFSRGSIFFWQNIQQALEQIYHKLKPQGIALLGGGYGIATPEALLDEIKNKQGKQNVPFLDLDELLEMAKHSDLGAQIVQKKGRGFWLKMTKSS